MDPSGHGDRKHLGTQVLGVDGGGALECDGSATLGEPCHPGDSPPRVIQLTCAWRQHATLPSSTGWGGLRGRSRLPPGCPMALWTVL